MEVPQAKVVTADAPAPYWKCVVSALPELVIGLQCAFLWATREPLLGADWSLLSRAMQVEFLVIHSTLFLGVIALWNNSAPAWLKWRPRLFWGLAALYALTALSTGVLQLLMFIGLTFATYLGLLLNRHSPSAILQLGARWAVGFIVFMIAINIAGTPKDAGAWVGRASVVKAGALYFLLLAAVELSGLYLRVIPRHSAKILESLRNAKRTQD